MTLLAVGVSHKTASVKLRGKLSVPAERLADELAGLRSRESVSEAVIVSTCNRTEVYVVATTASEGVQAAVESLRSLPGMDDDGREVLASALYVRQGPGAVEHLFRVVSSLDSLVLGEAQIIGQVRRAYVVAEEAGASGELLNRLFRSALETGKRVRSETEVGSRSVSVSTVAVELAKDAFGTLDGRRVLVVGAGAMGELALTYLHEQGAREVTVANRTVSRAAELAARFGGSAASLDDLERCVARADIVIASAASDTMLVTPDLVSRARSGRVGEPLLLVDIALPSTVDPACSEVDGVICCDLDGLGAVANENAKARARESVRAEAIVAEQTDCFLAWLQEREVTPTVKQMHGKARTVCDAEVERALKALAAAGGREVSERERAAIEAMASAIAKKLLHGPTARLRKQAGDPDGYRYTEAARYLFGLDAYPHGFSCRSDDGRACRLTAGTTCARHGGGACPHGKRPEGAQLESGRTRDGAYAANEGSADDTKEVIACSA